MQSSSVNVFTIVLTCKKTDRPITPNFKLLSNINIRYDSSQRVQTYQLVNVNDIYSVSNCSISKTSTLTCARSTVRNLPNTQLVIIPGLASFHIAIKVWTFMRPFSTIEVYLHSTPLCRTHWHTSFQKSLQWCLHPCAELYNSVVHLFRLLDF